MSRLQLGHRKGTGGSESGVIAVWVAILSVVIFGVSAFAVDVARWYVEAEQQQKAADLAALAGVVYLPDNENAAFAAAREVAAQNGYAEGVTTSRLPKSDTQLKVEIVSSVSNRFAPVLGLLPNPDDEDRSALYSTDVGRSAVADFTRPVPLGSPCNVMGRQDMDSADQVPASSCDSRAPNYWLNIAGTDSSKDYGDDYSAAWCVTGSHAPVIDNCDGSTNSRYKSTDGEVFPGYVFIVEPETSGDLLLEAYDLGWVETGDKCEKEPDVGGSEPRFNQKDSDRRFCSGDVRFTSRGDGSRPVETKVSVLGPLDSPFRPLDAAPVSSTCTDFTYPGWNKEAAEAAFGTDLLLTQTYHRWTGLCGTAEPTRISGVKAGERYAVQIRTTQGGGHNRFSLRASMASGDQDAVRIYAFGRFSVYTNVDEGVSYFNLLQIDSSHAGKTIKVDLYDIGDAKGDIEVSLLQPVTPDQSNNEKRYEDCQGLEGSKKNGWVQGPKPVDLPQCGFRVSPSSSVNARLRTVYAPIPTDYKCTPSSDRPTDCWVTLKIWSELDQQDTTTWTAEVLGDPVRLVPEPQQGDE